MMPQNMRWAYCDHRNLQVDSEVLQWKALTNGNFD